MAILERFDLGRRSYRPVWQAMSHWTDVRGPQAPDQLWFVEHEPVFTQGRAGKPEHLLMPGDIPLVASDRGGQITYHGPGQLVMYPLLDVRRLKLGVRDLVSALEGAVIDVLAEHGIEACARADAPGVYVDGAKIASLGLRIRRGCSFHGVAFNVDMDLAPFDRINPCGYAGLRMTQLSEHSSLPVALDAEAERLATCFARRLDATLEPQHGRPQAFDMAAR
ncbi:lipoyl(octanoyl) transferase LipB [Salinicola aestuarinus]|uniref:lipoyl(octanoyl) transferase LipB n=1 Tax=Salinicola aestuarinus TaxID=1949082 RepID=UPI000DA180B3|nr:lipoyl(octanoyl) transferase LipB [Salinicola aestuarinus]